MQTREMWLKEMVEWERTIEYEVPGYSIRLTEIRKWDRFLENGKVYQACSNPFVLHGNVYLSVWNTELPKGTESEMRLPQRTFVELMFAKTPPPFPHWYIQKRE